MALLRNREVSVLDISGSEDPKQLFTVVYPNGELEVVSLSEITFSESEQKEFKRKNGERLANVTKTIPDKDYQEILDNQDAVKIREKQTKQKSNEPVRVPVMVSPSDVEKAK